jgi:hypothetical protein
MAWLGKDGRVRHGLGGGARRGMDGARRRERFYRRLAARRLKAQKRAD